MAKNMTELQKIADAVEALAGGGGGGSGSSTLVGLTDVDISNPTDGQTLTYNATTGKWVNGAGIMTVYANENVLDKTFQQIVDAISDGYVVMIVHKGIAPVGAGFLFESYYVDSVESIPNPLQGDPIYKIGCFRGDNSYNRYIASTPNDYPVYDSL